MLGLSVTSFAQEVNARGDIDIISTKTNPLNANGRQSVCQCDTIIVKYYLKAGNNFVPNSDFEFQFASPDDNFPGANLVLTNLYLNATLTVKASTVADTFRTGVANTLYAELFVPCNATPSNSLRILNRQPNGAPSADGISDTVYFTVGGIPTQAEITYARFLDGSIPQENLYTNDTDLAMCPGDTIILRALANGTNFLWYQNDVPLPGPNGLPVPHSVDTLIVTGSGIYRFESYNGSCFISSEDTIINVVNTPTAITYLPNPQSQAFQIDNLVNNGGALDSVKFCREGGFATFEGPDTTGLNGIVFEYQWLTDTIDSNTGNPIFFRADTSMNGGLSNGFYDTSRVFRADNRLISFRQDPTGNSRFEARLYLRVFDGYCADTSDAYLLFMDTIPNTIITNQKYMNGALGVVQQETLICMKDSLRLRASYPPIAIPPSTRPTNVTYQWQQSSNGLSWANMSGVNMGFDDKARVIQIDTSLNPDIVANGYIYYYRVLVNVNTPGLAGAPISPVCSFVSDSIIVRWLPQDSITIGNPGGVYVVNNLIQPEVSICENDTAVFNAPAAPTKINNFFGGYTYQWVTDSLASGVRVKYPIAGETLREFRVSPDVPQARFWVVVSDAFCMDTLGPVTVYVDTLPETQIFEAAFPGQSIKNLIICDYDSLRLGASPIDINWNYQWQVYNHIANLWVVSVNDTLPNLIVDNTYRPIANDTAYFRLRTTYVNQFGQERCPFVSDSIQVIFVAPPVTSFIPSDSIGLCAGDSVLVIATGTGLSYRWNNGLGLTQSYWISAPGDYPVRVTGVNGCISFDTVKVYNRISSVDAGPDITLLSGEIGQITGSGGLNYTWRAELGKPVAVNTFFDRTISVSYNLPDSLDADTIKMYLTVTDNNSCSAIDSMRIFVTRENNEITSSGLDKAFNLFSPNGDGINDVWNITSVYQPGDVCKIRIINRWGATVFDQENFNGLWDGNDNGGNALPDGTYYYILSCNALVRVKSAITLMRNEN